MHSPGTKQASALFTESREQGTRWWVIQYYRDHLVPEVQNLSFVLVKLPVFGDWPASFLCKAPLSWTAPSLLLFANLCRQACKSRLFRKTWKNCNTQVHSAQYPLKKAHSPYLILCSCIFLAVWHSTENINKLHLVQPLADTAEIFHCWRSLYQNLLVHVPAAALLGLICPAFQSGLQDCMELLITLARLLLVSELT